MMAYFLIRESVSLANATLAAIQRTDLPELSGWLTASADTQVCLLNDHEFERAKTFEGAIVLSSELYAGKEVAIAFGPCPEWPEEFGRFRNFFAEAEKRRIERENITEEQWLGWDNRPEDLANFVLCQASDRQIRLFAVACCDLVVDSMVDARSRRAVEVARAHADAATSDEDLSAAHQGACEVTKAIRECGWPGRREPGDTSPEFGAAVLAASATSAIDRTPTKDMPDGWLSLCTAMTVSDFIIWHTRQAADSDALLSEKVTGRLRDICGNPFRPVVIEQGSLSPVVVSLAKYIYELKAFDRLPQLADALEEAGCNSPSILHHCRTPGTHVQGCWVLDLVLGRELLSV